jgi:hypothetical protein
VVRKILVLLGASVALFAGGLANPVSASAQPADAMARPSCVTALPPGGGFYRDIRYSQPNACRKCQEEGGRLEATGRWDAHCQNILNPAGTVTAVQLWLRCIACLRPDKPNRDGPRSQNHLTSSSTVPCT